MKLKRPQETQKGISDQAIEDPGLDASLSMKPSIAYVGHEMVMAYGDTARVYHVTERATAADIEREGFLGGWGDCGFGLYVYTSPSQAHEYAQRGGWDHGLQDPIVLVAHLPIRLLQPPDLHPDWDPESYECVLWVAMDEDAEAEALRPEVLISWDALAGDPVPTAELRQTDTQAFKSWFGQSQVTEPGGAPLVLYHGTRSVFNEFSHTASVATPWLLGGDHKNGFFFTKHPGRKSDSGPWGGAAGFAGTKQVDGETHVATGGNIMPVYLSLQCPYKMTAEEYRSWGVRPQFKEELEALGYDGVEVEDGTYIAFEATQVKSASGNCGEFDPTNPDMTR